MIAIVRKNFACLISKHNSFLCKSPVPFSLFPHLLSTLSERQLDASNGVYNVLLQKYKFSPKVASLVASNLSRFRSPERADSILSFLKENGFSTIQLEKIVKYDPRYLTAKVEGDIKFKIKILQDLGLSSKDVAKLISANPVILQLSATNNILPSLRLLKDMLGSDDDVTRLLRKSGWCLTSDLGKTLVPNVEFLKSCGVPMERILMILYNYPRSLLIKPDVMRKTVDKVKELGIGQSSNMFIHAVQVIAPMRKGKWELKLQAFRDLGFSDSETLTMFRKLPPVIGVSREKMRKVKELLLATGKFDLSSIVRQPSSLGSSIENRYNPRLRILGILESRNLINKWPSLSRLCNLTDDMFFERFIRPYSKEINEAFVTKANVDGKRG